MKVMMLSMFRLRVMMGKNKLVFSQTSYIVGNDGAYASVKNIDDGDYPDIILKNFRGDSYGF